MKVLLVGVGYNCKPKIQMRKYFEENPKNAEKFKNSLESTPLDWTVAVNFDKVLTLYSDKNKFNNFL